MATVAGVASVPGIARGWGVVALVVSGDASNASNASNVSNSTGVRKVQEQLLKKRIWPRKRSANTRSKSSLFINGWYFLPFFEFYGLSLVSIVTVFGTLFLLAEVCGCPSKKAVQPSGQCTFF